LALPEKNKKFIYSDAAFLLTLAIADNTLFGIKSLDDVQNMEILIAFGEIGDLASPPKDSNISISNITLL